MRNVKSWARWLAIGLLLTVILGGAVFFVLAPPIVERSHNQIIPHPPYRISAPARSLHDSLTIADLHSDSLLWDRDLLERSEYGHVDIPRLIEGNVALQVFTAVTKTPSDRNYVANPADSDEITLLVIAQLWPLPTWNSLVERALYQARKLHEFAQRSPDRLRVVRSADGLAAVLEARGAGKRLVAAVLGIEGAHALEGDLANFQVLFDAGYRVIGLTHFFDNEFGGSVSGMVKGGLTDMGRTLVRTMEDSGMIVDLAHASQQPTVGSIPCATANQADGIHVEHQRRGAARIGSFRIEHPRRAKRQLDLMHPLRVLVQQVPKIGRWVVGCGNCQEHVSSFSRGNWYSR